MRPWLCLSWFGCLLLLTTGWPPRAHAEEGADAPASATTADDPAPPRDFVSSRNIGDKLGEARRHRRSLFNVGVHERALRLEKRIYRATRIRFAGMYTYLSQHASAGNGPRDAAGGDLDVIATWEAVRRGGETLGALAMSFEGRHKSWTSIPPASLSNTIDSLWTTTSGFNVQDFFPVQIYWRQLLARGRLALHVGKLSAYSTFFGNRLNSSSLFFVNFAYADNPTVFMPGNGLGIHASYDISPHWTVHAGVQNANGVKTRLEPSSLDLGELWYALQVDYRAKIRGLGEGTWRYGIWYVNARQVLDQGEGGGAVLSIDQELGRKLIGFLRAEWQGRDLLNPEVAFDALTATRTSVRGGFGIPGPLRRLPDDYMGIGLAWGEPARHERFVKDSWVAEYFYRFQLESSTQLSFSAQVIRSSTVFEQVVVLSARLRLEF